MSHFRCLIQEGSRADARRDELERRLRENHGRHESGELADIHWVPIPPGRMFTEGKPSTSSIVSFFVERETTLDERASYMRGVCDLWTEVTECTDHEVVVTVTETTAAGQE